MPEAIRIEGLKEYVAALKRMDSDLPKRLRVGFNEAADLVVQDARPHVPRRSGKAAGSIRARSVQNKVRIVEGGSKAPYMPWLDFGGRTGKNKSVHRTFYKEGRYVWKSFARKRPEVIKLIGKALTDTARGAGLDVE